MAIWQSAKSGESGMAAKREEAKYVIIYQWHRINIENISNVSSGNRIRKRIASNEEKKNEATSWRPEIINGVKAYENKMKYQ